MSKTVGVIRRLTNPAEEPISLANAKLHLRVEVAADDTYISRLIRSARDHVEKYTGRAWATAQFIWTVPNVVADPFGDNLLRFKMPMPYVSSVDEIAYLDGDDTAQTLAASLYDLDIERQTVTIPDNLDGYDWRIKFTAGPDLGVSTEEVVPEAILQAMYLLIGDSYDNRQSQVLAASIAANPAAESLMHDYRINMGV